MKKNEKVDSITKENYQTVVERAVALRQQFREHYEEYSGFPSLSHVINVWGFNMSLKALCRHRTQVMKELGVIEIGKPTHTFRQKRREREVEPATLQDQTNEVSEEATTQTE